MIDKYLKYIQEGYLISDKTISIDLDKFISGESNKLIIAGLSGAGKSTLCRYLSKKYKAECFETDYCGRKITYKDKHFGAKNPPIKMLKEVFYEGYIKCIKPELMKRNKRQILEGGMVWQSFLFFPDVKKEIKKYPTIIFGSSALKATWGVFQRVKIKHNLPYAINKFPIIYARNFVLLKKLMDQFRSERVKVGGEIKEFKVPKL